MGFYRRWVLPRLIDCAMRNDALLAYRQRIISRARGRVLEVGMGSGLNLPLYGAEVECILGIDPSAELLSRARRAGRHAQRPFDLVQASAESIPIGDRAIDTVVMTWTLCSIPDPANALREMRRVLAPSGELLFVEHGLAPERNVEKWQHRLDPLWMRISCHLDRPIESLIRAAGFTVTELSVGYLPRGPKVMTFLYEGVARRN
jgi:ubiquinone/menaquinone biosynthesis C-methylase UbiE